MTTCAFCGKEPKGFASVIVETSFGEHTMQLCHGDEDSSPTCYEKLTVNKTQSKEENNNTLLWTQDSYENWCSSSRMFCVVCHPNRSKPWVLHYEEWDGPEMGPDFETVDQAKIMAQQIYDVLVNASKEMKERE